MFEVLEHTADIGFRARGRTIEETFEAAAAALVSIAMETDAIEPRETYPIDAVGEDREALLVNFLNEVLWLHDGRRIALQRFRVLSLTGESVRAEADGEPFDAARHAAKVIVKAVTYHQLRIGNDKSGWWCEVYLDI
ncbi:MAG TPA: archease [Bryobacteraceae bacterium]|nr:archease [Bryobacteraceae bacterium]